MHGFRVLSKEIEKGLIFLLEPQSSESGGDQRDYFIRQVSRIHSILNYYVLIEVEDDDVVHWEMLDYLKE